MTVLLPRGIRNHNPGNIRKSTDPWQGLAKEQLDSQFFTFQSPIYGIRALARTLITYQDKHCLNTIEGIVSRWAPDVENNTNAYIRAVAQRTGFEANRPLDMHRFDHLKPLVEAIIQHENGQQPYSDTEITKALVLAGVEPAAPKPAKNAHRQSRQSRHRWHDGRDGNRSRTGNAGASHHCAAYHRTVFQQREVVVAGRDAGGHRRHALGAD